MGLVLLLVLAQDTLTYRINDQAGKERIELKTDGDQLQVISRFELNVGTAAEPKWLKYDSTLIVNATSYAPLRFSVKGNLAGSPIEATASVTDGKIKVTRTQGTDKPLERTLDLEKDALLVDGYPLAHLWLLLKKATKSQEFRVFYGATLTHTSIFAEPRPDATLRSKDVTVKARHVFLRMEPIGLHAYLDDKGRVIRYTNPATGLTMVLEGFESYEVVDPLEVMRPDAVDEQEVSFQSGDIKLAGSLTRPKGSKNKLPLVILISGSGPVDRDENPAGTRFDIFNRVAYELSQNGFAVLRYDKRGVGKSEGDLMTTKLTDLIRDAESAIAWSLSAEGIDSNRIGVLGHSEGGLIAAHLAANNARVAFAFLMSAPADSMDKLMLKQIEGLMRASGAKDDDIKGELEARRAYFEKIKNAKSDVLEDSGGFIGWLREHFNYDPIATIKRAGCPVVITHAGKDAQIPPDSAGRLGAALKDVGKKRYEVTLFNELDHLYMKSEDGAVSRYYDRRPVDEGFLKFLVDSFKKYL